MTESEYKVVQFREDEFSCSKVELTKDTALKVVVHSDKQKVNFVLMFEKQIECISPLILNNSDWLCRFEKSGNYQLTCPLTPKAKPLLINIKESMNGKSLFNYKQELVNQFAHNDSTTVSQKKQHRDHSRDHLTRKKTDLLKKQSTEQYEASLQFCEFDSQQSNDCHSNQNESQLQETEKKACLTDSQSNKELFIETPKNTTRQRKKSPNMYISTNEVFLEDIGYDEHEQPWKVFTTFEKCSSNYLKKHKKVSTRPYSGKCSIHMHFLSKRYSVAEFIE